MLLMMNLIDEPDDRQYFSMLYETYRLPMYQVARSIVQSAAEAEDVVHDIFLLIAEKYLPRLIGIGSEDAVRGYLLTAARNTALSRLQAGDRRFEQPTEAIGELADTKDPSLKDSVFEEVCSRQELEQLLAALSGLPPEYRDTLYLRYVGELSVKEIAELSGCKAPTVRQRLHRGRLLLMTRLDRKEGKETT